MADELTRSREHLKAAMWDFIEATYELDWDQAKSASDDALTLIRHIKQIHQRAADDLTKLGQDLGVYDE
jgi:hypothetical protein